MNAGFVRKPASLPAPKDAVRRNGSRTHGAADRIMERDGVALMLALLFITLLTVIVVEYCYETEVEAALVTNDEADFDAYVAAKSAVAAAMGLLTEDLLDLNNTGSAESDSFIDPWAFPAVAEPINDGMMQYSIDDEYGKLNLNALFYMDPDGNVVENELLTATLGAFLELRVQTLGLEENPAEAILDWLDPDSDVRSAGAEAEYYSLLEIPYPCKNGPMDSVDELLMIRGVTPELFFGIAAQQETQMPPEEPLLPLTEYLTVHGDSRGRINVNTAEPEILDALFDVWELADPGQVETILERRANENPFVNVDELTQLFGGRGRGRRRQATPVQDVLTVSSRMFRVYGDGTAQDARVRIEAYVWRNPGQTDDGGTVEAEEVFRILDWRVTR